MFTGCAYEIPSVKLQFCIFTTLCILALLTEKIDIILSELKLW